MERRTALTAAAAVTLTVAAGALAIAANLGILGTTAEAEPAGALDPAVAPSPQAQPTEVETVYVDQTIHVRPRPPAPDSSASSQSAADTASPPPVTYVDDSSASVAGSDDAYESESHGDDGRGEHTYEGWDEDD